MGQIQSKTHRSGISSAYGGVLSALEIVYTLTAVSETSGPDHRQDPFVGSTISVGHTYIEKEEVYAIYPERREMITVQTREITL